MKQYIDKATLVEKINKRIQDASIDCYGYQRVWAYNDIKSIIDTLEVKEVKEEPVSKDLEDYANKESESFAEREYEMGYIDWNALAKGYYWGVKAGAQWQKEQKPAEWNKEDYERYISCLQRLGTGNPDQPETINSKWFKEHVTSLPHWKPSEVQMKALHDLNCTGSISYIGQGQLLISLYENLKEL